ncbi:MAG: type II CAAX endopeptidase family protein [Promethearchaeia archaeon]
MQSTSNRKKQIIIERFIFFVEIAIVFFGVFLFSLIPSLALPLLLETNSIFYGINFYLLRIIAVLIGIPLFLYFSNLILNTQKQKIILEDDASPALRHIKLFKVKKSNLKYQVLYGFLLFFIIFLPLDYITYLLEPKILEYVAVSISSSSKDIYLTKSYLIFLFSVLIVQFSVSFYEETLVRGFLTNRGSQIFNKISAVIISSFYFGLMHFVYYLNPLSRNYPFWLPFIWFLQTFFVGIIFSLFIINKRWLFPVIIAHFLNNIVSAHAAWNYLQGNPFSFITFTLYLPLLGISIILFIWQFSRIKNALKTGFKQFGNYFKKQEYLEKKQKESNSDRIVRIGIDLFLGFLILFLGLTMGV